MDAGRVVEYDQPLKLLQGDDGVFHGMVKALGSNEFIRLKNLAKKNDKMLNVTVAELCP